VTIHRALLFDHATIVGDNCMLMVNSHVAHDCHLGNNVIVTNNAMLAGHVQVADRAYISGAAGVHQFCRVGTLAMVGGQAHLTQDVPPYVTIDGLSSLVVGLNKIGLATGRLQSGRHSGNHGGVSHDLSQWLAMGGRARTVAHTAGFPTARFRDFRLVLDRVAER